MAILPAAFIVRVVLAPVTAAAVIGAETVMFPASASAPVVLMVTEVPEFSAASMVKLVMDEPVAEGAHVPVFENVPPVSVNREEAETTVTLIGSSSQLPATPLGAAAFILMPVTSRLWPEVSMKPPLPPLAP